MLFVLSGVFVFLAFVWITFQFSENDTLGKNSAPDATLNMTTNYGCAAWWLSQGCPSWVREFAACKYSHVLCLSPSKAGVCQECAVFED